MGALPDASCPRCGYDLTGMITAWAHASPLSAMCSECGLEFETARVLSAKYAEPPWSFEHRRRRLAGAFVLTMARCFRPRRLFGELHLEHPIRPGRLVAFLAVWPMLAHAGAVAARLVFAPAGSLPATAVEWGWVLLNPYAGPLWWTLGRTGLLMLAIVGVSHLAMPILMMALGETLSQAHVRRVHMLRGAYLFPPVFVLGTLVAAVLVLALEVHRFRIWGAPGLFTLALVLIAPGAAVVWWYVFLRDYLRLKRAGLVTCVLAIPTGLAVAAAVSWVVLSL